MISSHPPSTCHRQAQGRRDAGDAVAVGRAACAGHGAAPVVAGAVGGGTAAGAGCYAEGSEPSFSRGFWHENMGRNGRNSRKNMQKPNLISHIMLYIYISNDIMSILD